MTEHQAERKKQIDSSILMFTIHARVSKPQCKNKKQTVADSLNCNIDACPDDQRKRPLGIHYFSQQPPEKKWKVLHSLKIRESIFLKLIADMIINTETDKNYSACHQLILFNHHI
jgi:hypothetical protein